jgi:hypothetical protein
MGVAGPKMIEWLLLHARRLNKHILEMNGEVPFRYYHGLLKDVAALVT